MKIIKDSKCFLFYLAEQDFIYDLWFSNTSVFI